MSMGLRWDRPSCPFGAGNDRFRAYGQGHAVWGCETTKDGRSLVPPASPRAAWSPLDADRCRAPFCRPRAFNRSPLPWALDASSSSKRSSQGPWGTNQIPGVKMTPKSAFDGPGHSFSQTCRRQHLEACPLQTQWTAWGGLGRRGGLRPPLGPCVCPSEALAGRFWPHFGLCWAGSTGPRTGPQSGTLFILLAIPKGAKILRTQ